MLMSLINSSVSYEMFVLLSAYLYEIDLGRAYMTYFYDVLYLYASNMVLQSGPQPAVLVWDCATLALVSELKGHLYGVACIAFSPDG